MRVEIAIIGSGVIGAAVAWQCASRQLRTAIIDRYPAPHAHGSSHGQTRLLRVAYAEGSRYVPLVRRAITLWNEIGREVGEPVFRQSGMVYVGQEDSPLIAGVRAAAADHDVALREVLPDARTQVAAPLSVADRSTMLIENEGGYLYAEHAVGSMLALARRHGQLHERTANVRSIDQSEHAVTLRLDTGETIEAARVIVCAGAWVGDLLPEVGKHVTPQRVVMHWFDADPSRFGEQAGFRPFAVHDAAEGSFFYGFPRIDGLGVKVGDHLAGESLHHANERRVNVGSHEVAPIERLVRRHLRELGAHRQSRSCLYSSTASGDFLLDWAPGSDRVYVCAGFSGHGFKFAPAIGEAVAQTVLAEATTSDIRSFASLSAAGTNDAQRAQ